MNSVWILFLILLIDKVDPCQVGSYIIQGHICVRVTKCYTYASWIDSVKDVMVKNEGGHCVSLCKNGTYVYNGKCVQQCHEKWSILSNTFCTEECPKDTFRPRDRPLHCDYCHPECDGCFGKNDFECNHCKNKQYNGKCVRSCPSKTFEDNGKCLDTCPDPKLSHGGECVDQCPDGFYPARDAVGAGICQGCHPLCKTCNGPRDSECFTCVYKKSEGRCVYFCQMPKPVYFNGTCVAKCPQGNVQLDQGCVDQCPDNYYTVDEKCIQDCTGYFVDGQCVEECPASHYILTNNNICILNCPLGLNNTNACVRSCQQFLFQDACLEKCPKFYLTDLENKKCVQSCPKAYPLINGDICTDHCPGVSYNSVCYNECPNGFPTVDTVCVRECPLTYPYLDPQNNQCKEHCTNLILDNKCVDKCPPALEERNGTCVPPCPSSLFDLNGTCVDQCPEKVLVNLRQCVSSCPNGTFTDGDMCQQCHSECLDFGSCSGAGADQCGTCRHYKYDSKCVSACPSTHLFIDQTNVCVKICPQTVPFVKEGDQLCIKSCPNEYMEIVGQRICDKNCTSHSLLQTPNNKCVEKCPDTYPYKNGSDCVAQCPREFVKAVDSKDNKICLKKCLPPTELLTPQNICVKKCPWEYPWSLSDNGTISCRKTCPIGMYVHNGDCIKKCPNETFPIFDSYCSLKNPEKCEKKFPPKDETVCPQGFIDYCTGTCMSLCPNGTSVLLWASKVNGNNLLHFMQFFTSDTKVCTTLSHKIGLPLVVLSTFLYITGAVYTWRKYWTIRQKNPLRKWSNCKKLLHEEPS